MYKQTYFSNRMVKTGILTLLTVVFGLAALNAAVQPEPVKSGATGMAQEKKSVNPAEPLPAEFNQTKAEITGHTEHPQAQWFPDAAMGLFMHWGPTSVDGRELSWSMYKNYSTQGKEPDWNYRRYNEQFERFNPTQYDPNKWMEAAAKAGFRYMVITARHHDGYPLWASKWDAFGKPARGDRSDYLRPLVDAARKHGVRVGIYYSPTNWNYCPEGWPHHAFPLADPEMSEHHPEADKKPRFDAMPVPQMQQYLDRFINEYCKGELEQLLTEYGKIDLLWFDGFDWPKQLNFHGPEILAWVRQLQPGIVINDRWAAWHAKRNLGDLRSWERKPPEKRPGEDWWELCTTIAGGWSYRPGATCKPTSSVLDELARVRGWGGNYLPNVGPGPDGTMTESYYRLCEEMAAWMQHSGESIAGVRPAPASVISNVPITVRDEKTWYFLATVDACTQSEPLKNWSFPYPKQPVQISPKEPTRAKTIQAMGVKKPVEAICLRTGDKLEFTYTDGQLTILIPASLTTRSVDVVRVGY